ncbi:hypothetical protein MMC25_004498 [Agyrium rufum]|nr:hypothetical protein [Agyrium rufum]
MPFSFPRSSPTILLPTYLLPANLFSRQSRRKSSTDSTASTSNSSSPASTSPPTDPAPFLTSHTSYLRCARCSADLCHSSQIISKGFTGRHGRAYLISPTSSASARMHMLALGPSLSPSSSSLSSGSDLPNTRAHAPVPRHLVTGAHTVSDVECAFCASVLGWKYVDAEDEAQKYKVGKYILETKMICKEVHWEGLGNDYGGGDGRGGGRERENEMMPPERLGAARGGGGVADEDQVEFDSQDEDECEDLFAGVWSQAVARRRRARKRFTSRAGADYNV